VDWAANFGHQCPSPDFQAANKRYATELVAPLRSALRPYKQALEYGGVAVVVAAALFLINRRRRKAQ